ncbi:MULTISPECIES: AraC family transcriptional regulator [unclassified Mycobacterium]|uniref:AraC family transcriptional regulator n=1 Tax=unclassified Mycobacterium TaxID=2642494 RepID=UPI0009921BAD|nr:MULTISPECIES: AraC family transcriptional regulator [unclassified Mycobacterium]
MPLLDAATAYTIPIQRVQAFAGLALRCGWDVETMLGAAGVSPTLLAEGRSRVTTDQAGVLFRELWRQTDDELLGLGLTPVPRGTFRLLCYALINAPDLGAAMQRFADFKRAVPGIPPVTVIVRGDTATLSIDLSKIEQPVDLLIDTLLAMTHRFLGWAIGKRIPLRRVEVPYAERAEVDDYDLIFGAPMVFSADHPTLVFDRDNLSAPVVRDEGSLDDYLRHAPASVITYRSYATSTASRVRLLLAQGLTGNWLSFDEIAATLTMSPQTLRRKLRDEGTSPREIKEEILRDAAITSLVRGEETVAALSRRLGFSEPSAFSRAFRRWTGSPPGSYQH